MNFSHSKDKGNAGIGIAIAYFSVQGYTVSIPLTDTQSYDLIVDDGQLKKVQVKFTSHKEKSDSYKVDLRTRGHGGYCKNFNKNDIDLLFAVTEQGEQYIIPSHDINAVSAIVLGDKYQVYRV